VIMRNKGATGDAGAARGAPAAGTTPLASSREGDSVLSMASRIGLGADWRSIAAVNNVEDPRNLTPGTLLNLNVRASASVRGPRLTS
ncbi:MAG: LysM peptidoglycan-binding domain-containing protein, partial [Chloroflexi bacterium]|nr:LysM peptidoglycan-binding domain-containing protein [Chloroflexota bacterium]